VPTATFANLGRGASMKGVHNTGAPPQARDREDGTEPFSESVADRGSTNA
jgi:hypothetical protein